MSAVATFIRADGAAAINVSFESVLDRIVTRRRRASIPAGPSLAPIVGAVRVGKALLPVPAGGATAAAAVQTSFRPVLRVVLATCSLADVTRANSAVTVRTHGASFAGHARFAVSV